MFCRVKNKIEVFIIFATVFIIVLATISISSTFLMSLKKDFINHSAQSAEQLNNNIKLNLASFEPVANLLIHNVTIIDAISVTKHNTDIIPILDSILMTNMNIAGACLYGVNGTSYYSSTASSPPPLDFIIENELPQSFIKSSNNSIWILREYTMQQYKNYIINYRSPKGLFSYVSKLKNDKGELLGYLLLDIPINKIYSFPMNKDNIFLNNTNVCILNQQNDIVHCFKEEITISEAELSKILDDENITSPVQLKNAVITASNLENTNSKTVVYTSFEYIKNRFYKLLVILVILDALFILLVVLLVKPLSKSIYEPLQALYSKMKGINKLIQ